MKIRSKIHATIDLFVDDQGTKRPFILIPFGLPGGLRLKWMDAISGVERIETVSKIIYESLGITVGSASMLVPDLVATRTDERLVGSPFEPIRIGDTLSAAFTPALITGWTQGSAAAVEADVLPAFVQSQTNKLGFSLVGYTTKVVTLPAPILIPAPWDIDTTVTTVPAPRLNKRETWDLSSLTDFRLTTPWPADTIISDILDVPAQNIISVGGPTINMPAESKVEITNVNSIPVQTVVKDWQVPNARRVRVELPEVVRTFGTGEDPGPPPDPEPVMRRPDVTLTFNNFPIAWSPLAQPSETQAMIRLDKVGNQLRSYQPGATPVVMELPVDEFQLVMAGVFCTGPLEGGEGKMVYGKYPTLTQTGGALLTSASTSLMTVGVPNMLAHLRDNQQSRWTYFMAALAGRARWEDGSVPEVTPILNTHTSPQKGFPVYNGDFTEYLLAQPGARGWPVATVKNDGSLMGVGEWLINQEFMSDRGYIIPVFARPCTIEGYNAGYAPYIPATTPAIAFLHVREAQPPIADQWIMTVHKISEGTVEIGSCYVAAGDYLVYDNALKDMGF